MAITYSEEADVIIVFSEDRDDETPIMGFLRKNKEGFYEFHPFKNIVMTQKRLRTLAGKVSELNTIIT